MRGRSSDSLLLDMQDEIERLGDQKAEQDRRIEELHDRLDFAERMLARGSAVPDEPEETATPVS